MQKGCSENVTLNVNSGTVSNFVGLIFYLTQMLGFIHLFILFIYFFSGVDTQGRGRGDIGICGVAVSLIISGGDLKPYGVRCF